MPDWTKSMQRTYEYYIVDPGSWTDKSKINTITKSKIERYDSADTLGSASLEATESIGECYVRIYLITIQNGIREKFSLGTFLVQTPSVDYDGRVKKIVMDAYTPLLELKENPPPLGYSIMKEANIMDTAYNLCWTHMRGPVVKTSSEDKLYCDFVANTDDTWLTYIRDLIANAKYDLGLDEYSRVIFLPYQELDSLQPVWSYNDDNSSILYSDISLEQDLYGVPTTVEVIYTGTNNSVNYHAKAVNDDPNSPTSIISRGREIVYRDTDPDISGIPTTAMLQEYAERLLKKLSSIECTITYTHGYNGVRVGDCVRMNYSRAEITDIKAKVTKQTIECDTAGKVTETAVFTKQLWEG